MVECDGQQRYVHVPTSSRMREQLLPGAEVLVVDRAGEGRVTVGDLVQVRTPTGPVSVDSRVPNRLLELVLRAGAAAEFAGWDLARREVVLGESRLDFLLTQGEQRCWIEAKSVTLVEEGVALFPDAPTERGARHLRELAQARAAGDRAAAVFVIQRADARQFSPHRVLDPVFAQALNDAIQAGVEVYAYLCDVREDGIRLDVRVPVVV